MNKKLNNKQRIEKFYSYFDRLNGKCWNWKGALCGGKYGAFYDGSKLIRAHRFSYELHKGIIPKNLVVMHACDNMKCVNPSHLSVGTMKDNIQDALKKGRMKVGEAFWCAKTNEETVNKIRAEFRKPFTFSEECKRLGEKYKVGWRTVYHIAKGVTWKHLL